MNEEYDFTLPDNIMGWLKEHYGANVSINVNSTDGLNGYGQLMHYSVHVSMLTRTCHRCGYDRLWKPDDSESKCQRHTYNSWRYDDVFVWRDRKSKASLKEEFEKWLTKNRDRKDGPMVQMVYGEFI